MPYSFDYTESLTEEDCALIETLDVNDRFEHKISTTFFFPNIRETRGIYAFLSSHKGENPPFRVHGSDQLTREIKKILEIPSVFIPSYPDLPASCEYTNSQIAALFLKNVSNFTPGL